jgi:hypothetical protein
MKFEEISKSQKLGILLDLNIKYNLKRCKK